MIEAFVTMGRRGFNPGRVGASRLGNQVGFGGGDVVNQLRSAGQETWNFMSRSTHEGSGDQCMNRMDFLCNVSSIETWNETIVCQGSSPQEGVVSCPIVIPEYNEVIVEK